jgi:diketogulonate reductase-like aldo/keto reductase
MDVMINTYADQVGFGTAALGRDGANVVLTTLETGFRKFDTAEESDHWYDQAAVGSALRSFFLDDTQEGEEPTCRFSCQDENLQISTKLPPWELTSVENIRTRGMYLAKLKYQSCSSYSIQLDHSSFYLFGVWYILNWSL